MHSYSIDSHERRYITFFLAIISLLLGFFLRKSISNFAIIQDIVFVVDVVSPLAIFGFLYSWFDKWGWKIGLLRTVVRIKTPDLNGTWRGKLFSSNDNFQSEHPIEINIYQTWSHIVVRLRAKSSQSKSESASIISKYPQQSTLIYHYRSDPNSNNPTTMTTHIGTTRLEFENTNKLFGKYYTGRDRGGNYGDMKLKKIN